MELLLFKVLHVGYEGQLSWLDVLAATSGMHQPTHRIVRQHPAVELLAYQVRRFTAQHPPPLMQVRLQLVKDTFDFPALVINRRQLQSRCLGRLKQRSQEPIPGVLAIG